MFVDQSAIRNNANVSVVVVLLFIAFLLNQNSVGCTKFLTTRCCQYCFLLFSGKMTQVPLLNP